MKTYTLEDLGFKETEGYTGIMYIKETTEKFELLGEIEKRIFIHFVDNTVNVKKSLFIGAGTDEPIDMKLFVAIQNKLNELGYLKDSDIK